MNKILCVISLCLLATNVLAEKVNVRCYSGERQIFNKVVHDVFPGDGYIAAVGKTHTYIIVGDCVITYHDKKNHHVKHKVSH